MARNYGWSKNLTKIHWDKCKKDLETSKNDVKKCSKNTKKWPNVFNRWNVLIIIYKL